MIETFVRIFDIKSCPKYLSFLSFFLSTVMQARKIGFDSRLDLGALSAREKVAIRPTGNLLSCPSRTVFTIWVIKKKPEVAFPSSSLSVSHLVYNGVTLREQREREREESGLERTRKRDRWESLYYLRWFGWFLNFKDSIETRQLV